MDLLTEEQRIALDVAASGHRLIITGQCGTGKTHLLRCIVRHLQEQKHVAVTSTTGMASTILGNDSTTLHHWSGIGDGRLSEAQLQRRFSSDDRFADANDRIRKADVLVIDEIGMLSSVTFNKVEHVCRIARGNNDVFGGIQVIATGDFKQLAPVPNYRYHDPGNRVFNSSIFKSVFPHHINLKTVVRQNEPGLIKAVNQLCDGQPDPETEEFVKSLQRPLDDEYDLCRLFGTKFDAAYVNQFHLDRHPGEPIVYKSTDKGNTRLLLNCDAERHLSLKTGAPVILIRNLPGKLNNGLIGKVYRIERDHSPVINFNGRLVNIPLTRFEIYDPDEEKVLAERIQYPLKLAFAMTVHRAQGQTLRNVEIDCFSFFAAGQMGVALGRAVQTNGIRVINYNPDAARIKHPTAVYEFSKYEGVPYDKDLSCCIKQIQVECIQNGPPTERGDADRTNQYSDDYLSYKMNDKENTTTGGANYPWNIHDFLRDHKNLSFLPSAPLSKGFITTLKAHMEMLNNIVKGLIKKNPRGNEDFVSIYKKLNGFLTSDAHAEACLALTDSGKKHKLSSKMAYWILNQRFLQISQTFIDQQEDVLLVRNENLIESDLSSAGKAKVRYVSGACISKILTRLRAVVSRNMGKDNERSKVQREWSYRMHKLLKSLRISEEEAVRATRNQDSLAEIEFRQGPSRGLIHVSDATFDFFVSLHQYVQRLVTKDAFHFEGENIHLFARGKLLNNDILVSVWLGLFGVDEADSDETFLSLLVELYELVTEHFLRISIVEGLHSFKAEIPRKKKQALRSKVAALSERQGIDKKLTPTEHNKEPVFLCPSCGEACQENPKLVKDNSIGCDKCNQWFHFKCVNIRGDELFLKRSNSSWKCTTCSKRGTCVNRKDFAT